MKAASVLPASLKDKNNFPVILIHYQIPIDPSNLSTEPRDAALGRIAAITYQLLCH